MWEARMLDFLVRILKFPLHFCHCPLLWCYSFGAKISSSVEWSHGLGEGSICFHSFLRWSGLGWEENEWPDLWLVMTYRQNFRSKYMRFLNVFSAIPLSFPACFSFLLWRTHSYEDTEVINFTTVFI